MSLRHVLFAALLIALPQIGSSQVRSKSFTLGVHGGMWEGDATFDTGPTVGARAGFNFNRIFGVELHSGWVFTEGLVREASARDGDQELLADPDSTTIFNMAINGIIHLSYARFVPYLTAGGGWVDVDEMYFALNAGFGAAYYFNHMFAARIEGRGWFSENAVSTDRYHHLEANLGLVIQLGGDDDLDKDGIKNADDQCPSEPEDKDNFEDSDGCPDKDNDKDGLLDANDKCPNEPEDKDGVEDEDGCPDLDRDGDGIDDAKDKCPSEPEDKDGFEDTDGCPDLDNDADGIPDAKDKCPLKPEDKDGFEDDDGCPDTDNDRDGIIDAKDKCPDQAENINQIEDEDGCPEQAVIVTRKKIEINQKIFFETDKAVIRAVSFDLLNQVAATLKEFTNITRVEIQGHTDNRGSAEYNQDLSERRADAVRAYLIEKGDVEPDRLVTQGFGSSQPIEGDTESESWEKSRRVEFVILNQAGADNGASPAASPTDEGKTPSSEDAPKEEAQPAGDASAGEKASQGAPDDAPAKEE